MKTIILLLVIFVVICEGWFFSWGRRRNTPTWTAKRYACSILTLRRNGKLELGQEHASGKRDNAYALNNVQDTCNGYQASRSRYTCRECRNPGAPGGVVSISKVVLKYIYNLANSGHYLRVNEIAGACHTCSSKHYSGLAVDIHKYSRRWYHYKTECENLGGTFLDNYRNHYHCGF